MNFGFFTRSVAMKRRSKISCATQPRRLHLANALLVAAVFLLYLNGLLPLGGAHSPHDVMLATTSPTTTTNAPHHARSTTQQGLDTVIRAHSPELHFIAQVYSARTPKRQVELDACLQRQLANHAIDHIHILFESEEEMGRLYQPHPKATAYVLGHRMTFADAVQFGNEHLAGKLVGLANMDIYLDDSLELLHRIDLAAHGLTVFLTRYDVEDDYEEEGMAGMVAINDYDNGYSHDTFIWASPMPNAAQMYPELNFTMGLPGCENKFMWAVEHIGGLRAINPCHSIRSYHVHASRERNYNEKQRVDRDKTKSRSTYPSTLYAAVEHALHRPVRESGEGEGTADDLSPSVNAAGY